jgi:hypothetical protein
MASYANYLLDIALADVGENDTPWIASWSTVSARKTCLYPEYKQHLKLSERIMKFKRSKGSEFARLLIHGMSLMALQNDTATKELVQAGGLDRETAKQKVKEARGI